MLYESPHVWADAADGVATLWLSFSTFDPTRAEAVGRAVDVLARRTDLDAVVVRSAIPAGFCRGFAEDALETLATDPTPFAQIGQKAFAKLAAIPAVTVVFVEGPCLGPGLELALACDYRLAVAGPDSWVGFPDRVPPCWGGPARLTHRIGRRASEWFNGNLFTAKEAVRDGVFDDAFSARRAKVELRLFLDHVQSRPRKRSDADLTEGLAAERLAVRATDRTSATPQGDAKFLSFDECRTPVAVFGSDPALAEFACETALRGRIVSAPAASDQFLSHFADALTVAIRRGRVTPLEADQARKRLDSVGTHLLAARFAVADRSGVPALLVVEPKLPPACVIAVPSDLLDVAQATAYRPQRVVGCENRPERVGFPVATVPIAIRVAA